MSILTAFRRFRRNGHAKAEVQRVEPPPQPSNREFTAAVALAASTVPIDLFVATASPDRIAIALASLGASVVRSEPAPVGCVRVRVFPERYGRIETVKRAIEDEGLGTITGAELAPDWR